MNAATTEIRVKRVSSRKRSRDSLRSHLTPAKKSGGSSCSQQCPKTSRLCSIMADVNAVEVCCCPGIEP